MYLTLALVLGVDTSLLSFFSIFLNIGPTCMAHTSYLSTVSYLSSIVTPAFFCCSSTFAYLLLLGSLVDLSSMSQSSIVMEASIHSVNRQTMNQSSLACFKFKLTMACDN